MDDNEELILRVNAVYNPCSIEAYNGNPLIEALPDYISSKNKDIINKLAYIPDKPQQDASLREKSEWLRRFSTTIFIPFAKHLDLQKKITILLMLG